MKLLLSLPHIVILEATFAIALIVIVAGILFSKYSSNRR